MQAAEAVVLAAVVAGLYWLLRPARRRLEDWLTRRLRPRRPARRGRLVVLGRRSDGTYARDNGHER